MTRPRSCPRTQIGIRIILLRYGFCPITDGWLRGLRRPLDKLRRTFGAICVSAVMIAVRRDGCTPLSETRSPIGKVLKRELRDRL